MKQRRCKAAVLAAAACAAVSLTAFPAMAGSWKQGSGESAGSWWYDLGNGKWAEGWEWIDGDNDGVAERYYFDGNGWLLTGTVTPDGFTVNAEGAWVDGGNVRIMVNSAPGEETPAQAAEKETSASAVELARSYVGKLRYVYGGFSLETGTDCSGFTKLIFAKFGKELPRGTGDQLGSGTRLSADQIQPGDLVFWANGSGRIYHVGILSGNGMFIHASNSARGWVFEDRLSDMPSPAGYARY